MMFIGQRWDQSKSKSWSTNKLLRCIHGVFLYSSGVCASASGKSRSNPMPLSFVNDPAVFVLPGEAPSSIEFNGVITAISSTTSSFLWSSLLNRSWVGHSFVLHHDQNPLVQQDHVALQHRDMLDLLSIHILTASHRCWVWLLTNYSPSRLCSKGMLSSSCLLHGIL